MLTAFAILTDGLVYAAYQFVVAIGLTLIFGVMKILNVTHGSFYAFGAFGAAVAARHLVKVGFSRALLRADVQKSRPTDGPTPPARRTRFLGVDRCEQLLHGAC